uniref:Peptidase A1 domain-containing protein n=1 Tax=Ananas comosus var. bracteatus TaxID=296719 RepID=A0A6V7QE26_ANACO|nr:unnamed protein product [Ananas comosus var. bracteatus]
MPLILPPLVLLFFWHPLASSAFDGARIELTHVDSDGNYTIAELIRRAGRATLFDWLEPGQTSRLRSTRPRAPTSWSSPSARPRPYLGLADTGSTLVWIECLPCNKCTDLVVPKYDPSKSPTFSLLPCNSSLCKALDLSGSCLNGSCTYEIVYGSGATVGVLGSETFTFGSSEAVSVPAIGFGCSTDSLGYYSNSSGIVGLGKSSLSLVSQLGAGKNIPRRDTTSIPSTAFAIRTDGSGGLVIDSGTTFTYLEDVAYQLVKQAIQSLVNRPPADGSKLGLDLCYSLRPPPRQMPIMTFDFDGADMNLPVENYMLSDSETGLWCLAMLNSTDNSSILGNFQQQNMHILYDLDNDVLSFVPAQCSKL